MGEQMGEQDEILRPSLRSAIFALMIGIGFILTSALLLVAGVIVGAPGVILGAYATYCGLTHFKTGANELRIGQHGIVVVHAGRSKIYSWTSISGEFQVYEKRGLKRVAFNVSAQGVWSKLHRAGSRLLGGGFSHTLPDCYGYTADDLAAKLTRRRRLALGRT